MRGVIRSALVSLWFMALTFPLLVIKVSTLTGDIIWRFENAMYLGTAIFFLSFVWRAMMVWKGALTPEAADLRWLFDYLKTPRNQDIALGLLSTVIGAIALLLVLYALTTARSLASLEIAPIAVALLVAAAGFITATACFQGKRTALKTRLQNTTSTLMEPGKTRSLALLCVLLFFVVLPFYVGMYQVNVLASAFVWIMLGLGLNIVVGQTGLLVLGYVAFYAVGAYTYAVANNYFSGEFIGFWLLLPVGGFMAAIAGIALCIPVLRLRGDYLAIVTLGFGEIVRITLETGSISLAPIASIISLFTDATLPAWLTTPINLGGPAGISDIPVPQFFGLVVSVDAGKQLIYFIALALVVLTVVAVTRLRDSRLGRSWIALREDEIACEAMGINKAIAKLTSFALGACWAGFGGVLFAAKTGFINPTSFTFMESALILSVVVLGGLGSILGVVLGACILILLPEYLRSFEEYRMLIFGASMVLMMVFRPQGLIKPKAKKRHIAGAHALVATKEAQ